MLNLLPRNAKVDMLRCECECIYFDLNHPLNFLVFVHEATCVPLQLSAVLAGCTSFDFLDKSIDFLEKGIVALKVYLNLSPPFFPEPILLLQGHFLLNIPGFPLSM